MDSGKSVGSFSASSSSSSSSSSSLASSLNLVDGKEQSLSGSSPGARGSFATPGIFSSVFPPPATILGRNSLRYDAFGSLRKQDSEFQIGNTERASTDGLDRIGSSKSKSVPDKDLSSIYSDQAAEPYFLGDSLYYGGRDHYAHSSSAQGPKHHKNEKDGTEDDINSSDFASRGNWWQGSLYY